MPMYNAEVEYNGFPTISPDDVDQLMTELDEFHPAISHNAGHQLGIRISLPAENEVQAARTALAVAGAAVTPWPTSTFAGLTLLTEDEFNAREGWAASESAVIGVTDAAALLKVSPQRVRQMIEEGKFRSATRLGAKAWTLERAEVDALTTPPDADVRS